MAQIRLTKNFPGCDGLYAGVVLETYDHETAAPGHVWALTPGGYMRDGQVKLGRFVELGPGEFEVLKPKQQRSN